MGGFGGFFGGFRRFEARHGIPLVSTIMLRVGGLAMARNNGVVMKVGEGVVFFGCLWRGAWRGLQYALCVYIYIYMYVYLFMYVFFGGKKIQLLYYSWEVKRGYGYGELLGHEP